MIIILSIVVDSDELDHNYIFQSHVEWGKSLVVEPPMYKLRKENNRRLRIGYMSPDYFTHSVSYFMESILSNHQKCDIVW